MDANEGRAGAAPVVILPGLLCDSRMFVAQLAAFPGTTVIDDFYGGEDDLATMATYALPMMPRRVSLLGHSMGARVALEIVRRAPERIERLALADTGTHGPREGEREGRYRLRDLGRAEGVSALVDAWLPEMVGATAAQDRALMSALRAMCIDAGIATYEAQIEALLGRPLVEDLLPHITCPTFVIVGEEDRWAPVEQHRAIAAAIPGAHLSVISDAGHMAPAEQPRAFNDVLARWLTEVAPKSTHSRPSP